MYQMYLGAQATKRSREGAVFAIRVTFALLSVAHSQADGVNPKEE
jgi:hypothetical protein